MKRIGITGGIGAGKSTVTRIFEALDIPVYIADYEARKILSSNTSVKKQVRTLIGPEAFHKNGKPDRAYIASKIFNDPVLLAQLNKIVHPAVQLHFNRWCESFKPVQKILYVLQEAALLVETGNFKTLDALIMVACPEEIRIQRVMNRDNSSRDEVLSRMKNQLTDAEKMRVSDYTITNDGKHLLIPQVLQIHKQIIQKSAK
jgi:dephospho-CoA kinase